MSDPAIMAANNTILNANDFDIQLFVVDGNGVPTRELKELGSLVSDWAYVLAPNPFEDDEETEYDFGEDEEDALSLGLDHPDSEAEEEDADEEDSGEVGDEGVDASLEPYRELQLTHAMTGAAFQEVMHHVYRRKEQPAVSVSITYYSAVDGVRHPIFRHIFMGDIFMRDDLSGSHADKTRLTMTTNMDVFGSETYVDPTDGVEQVMARLAQEHSASSVH